MPANENMRQKITRLHGPLMGKCYGAWVSMRLRTRGGWKPGDKNFIYNDIVCEFDTFEEFLAEVGKPTSMSHSIDRIDGNKGYVPGNIRWATPSDQRRNQKCTKLSESCVNQIRKEYETGIVSQQTLAERYNVHQTMISSIIRHKTWVQGEQRHV